jgi:hypothetical protein
MTVPHVLLINPRCGSTPVAAKHLRRRPKSQRPTIIPKQSLNKDRFFAAFGQKLSPSAKNCSVVEGRVYTGWREPVNGQNSFFAKQPWFRPGFCNSQSQWVAMGGRPAQLWQREHGLSTRIG